MLSISRLISDRLNEDSTLIRFIVELLFRSYAFRFRCWRRIVRACVKRLEGGEFRSSPLRRVFVHYHGIEIGMYSYGGCFQFGNLPSGTRIGRYGSFSEFRVFARNHPLTHISTHPYFYNSSLGYVKTDKVPSTQLIIGHDVWIGYGVIILGHVTSIGNGAVIAAGTTVTKDVPSYAVVAGNPARVIKYRFPPDIIERVEQLAWWNREIEGLLIHLPYFTEPLTLDMLLGALESTRSGHDDSSIT